MIQELFEKCAYQLCSEEFHQIQFLKTAAQLAPIPESRCGLLLIYGIYYSQYHKNYQKALHCIQQSLNFKPPDAIIALLFAAKGAIFSCIDKPNQALFALKQAVSIASGSNFNSQQLHIRKIFPLISSQILKNINTSRGRRQFLIFLDNIRVKTGSITGLEEIERMASIRVNDIRDHMRHNCREDQQQRDNINLRMKSSRRQASPQASIYITRLYEQRKMALGKRQHTGLKKKNNIDPYQWRKQQKQQNQGGCEYM